MTKIQAKRNIALAEALESGKYKQATGGLRTSEGFCCLGVACEVFRLDTGHMDWIFDEYQGGYTFGSEDYASPKEVKDYFGWRLYDPQLKVDDYGEGLVLGQATYHNDQVMANFQQIAAGFRLLAKPHLTKKKKVSKK